MGYNTRGNKKILGSIGKSLLPRKKRGASSEEDTQTRLRASKCSQGLQFREMSKLETVEWGFELGTVGGTTFDLNSAF